MEILLKQAENEIYKVLYGGQLFNPVDAPLRFCFPVAVPAEIRETTDIVIKIDRTAAIPGVDIKTLSDKIVITFQGQLPPGTANTAPIEFKYGDAEIHAFFSLTLKQTQGYDLLYTFYEKIKIESDN